MSSLIILVIFSILVIYYHNFGKSKPLFSDDIMIPIGYSYTERITEEKPAKVEKPKRVQPQVIKQVRPVKPVKLDKPIVQITQIDNSLLCDSIAALTKLGYKKSDAKHLATNLINSGVSDLNDLIIKAFKR
jgi:hypothetical protein